MPHRERLTRFIRQMILNSRSYDLAPLKFRLPAGYWLRNSFFSTNEIDVVSVGRQAWQTGPMWLRLAKENLCRNTHLLKPRSQLRLFLILANTL
jgi:hypothetical protein